MLLRKKLSDVRLGNCSTQILQIYWIYKDVIDLTSRWNVLFRQTFFQIDLQRVLYKLALVTYPLDHSGGIYSPSNFRFIKKTLKIKFVPITTVILPKINLEHSELLRPYPPLGPQIQLPGGPRFT